MVSVEKIIGVEEITSLILSVRLWRDYFFKEYPVLDKDKLEVERQIAQWELAEYIEELDKGLDFDENPNLLWEMLDYFFASVNYFLALHADVEKVIEAFCKDPNIIPMANTLGSKAIELPRYRKALTSHNMSKVFHSLEQVAEQFKEEPEMIISGIYTVNDCKYLCRVRGDSCVVVYNEIGKVIKPKHIKTKEEWLSITL